MNTVCRLILKSRIIKRNKDGQLNHSVVYKKSEFVTQSRLTLCDPMDCSTPGSSVHGILLARILEWVAVTFLGSSRPRDQTWVFCIAGRFFTVWATREAQKAHLNNLALKSNARELYDSDKEKEVALPINWILNAIKFQLSIRSFYVKYPYGKEIRSSSLKGWQFDIMQENTILPND